MKKAIFFLLILSILASCKTTAKNIKVNNRINIQISNQNTKLSYESIFYYTMAMFYLYNRNFENAEKFFIKASNLEPNSYYLTFKIANFYLHLGKLSQAIKYCEKTLLLQPDYSKAHELLGSIYAATNNIKGAIEEYKYLLNKMPHNPIFQLNYGLFLLKGEQYEKAKKTFRKLLSHKEKKYKVMSYYYLGKIYSKIKLYKDSLENYRKAIELNPKFSQAYYEIGLVYELKGDFKNAYANYLKVAEINPDNILAREKLVRYLVKNNKLKEALIHLNKLKELEGDNIDINIKLALVYIELKKFNNAVEILKKFREFPKAQYYLITAYLKLDKINDAIKTLKLIRPESGFYFDGAVLIINQLIDKKKYDKSLDIYLEVLKNFKNKNIKMYQFGLYLFNKAKRYKKALLFTKEAIKKFPNISEFYFYLGLFYDKLGNLEKSIESMKKAIKINPNSADALNYLGYTYAIHKIKLDEAEKLIKKALKIRPDSASIVDSLGWIYYQKGEYKKALKYLIKACKLNNDKEAEIVYHLGMAFLKIGKKEMAKKYLEKSFSIKTDDKEIRAKIKKALESLK